MHAVLLVAGNACLTLQLCMSTHLHGSAAAEKASAQLPQRLTQAQVADEDLQSGHLWLLAKTPGQCLWPGERQLVLQLQLCQSCCLLPV